jgi:hypothetical protein
MKKIILILLFAMPLAFISSTIAAQTTPKKSITKESKKEVSAVYICDSKSTNAYHSSASCKGMSKCSRGFLKVSIADAKQLGRMPCKICM